MGQGRADRITANDIVQTEEADRNRMFGQRGTEVFDGFTSEQRSNPEFVNAMALFYNAGNKRTSVNDISEQYRFVGTQEQREAMYKAGIADGELDSDGAPIFAKYSVPITETEKYGTGIVKKERSNLRVKKMDKILFQSD